MKKFVGGLLVLGLAACSGSGSVPNESKAKTITLSKMAVSATRVQNSNLEKINLKIPALFKPKTKEDVNIRSLS